MIPSIEEFQELLEEINDLATVMAGRGESTTSHDGLIAELKRDGVV